MPKEKDFVGISLCLSKEETYVILCEGFVTQGYLCDKLSMLAKNTKFIKCRVNYWLASIAARMSS